MASFVSTCVLGMFLWQATDPPDLTGTWSGTDLGELVLTKTRSGAYDGRYTASHNDKPGDVRLEWSRIERRFNGAWKEGPDCHGEISVRIVDGALRGSFTTDESSRSGRDVKPRLGDIHGIRVAANSTKKDDSKLLGLGEAERPVGPQIKDGEIVIDLYGPGVDYQDKNKLGKLLPALNVLRGVRVNLRSLSIKVDSIVLAVVRDPSKVCWKEAQKSQTESDLRNAINAALAEAGIKTVRWEEGPDTANNPMGVGGGPQGPPPMGRSEPDLTTPTERLTKPARPQGSSKLRIRNMDGSAATFNDVVDASVGYPSEGLPAWIGWPNRDGIVALDKLSAGTHWLVAASESPQRSVFRVAMPGNEPVVEARLRQPSLGGLPNIEVKPSVVIDERDRGFGEIIVVEIHNDSKAPITISHADLALRTDVAGGGRDLVVILSPEWQAVGINHFTRTTIEPAQTGTLKINWREWTKNGLWARRAGPIAEPGLPAAEPGRMWVRVGVRNSGFSLVSVRHPGIFGQKVPAMGTPLRPTLPEPYIDEGGGAGVLGALLKMNPLTPDVLARSPTNVRRLLREPKYASQPYYALLAFGPKAQLMTWIVVDGEVLYLDRNGNGDLTEPNERIELDRSATKGIKTGPGEYKGMNVFELGDVAEMKLQLQYWVRDKNFTAAGDEHPASKKYQVERRENGWENATLWRVGKDGVRAQNPIILSPRPSHAQMSHLGGPLTFSLRSSEPQPLERIAGDQVFEVQIGTLGLAARNSRYPVFSPLATSEVPADKHALAEFEFPNQTPGKAPIRVEFKLDQRCCGDKFYGVVRVPADAAKGNAKVKISFPDWPVGRVAPATFTIPVVDAKAKS